MRVVSKFMSLTVLIASQGIAVVSAQMDSSVTFKGEPVSIDVVSNDGPRSPLIKSVNESSVGWGRVTINEDKKSLTYTPNAAYTGYDKFWYVFEDNIGNTHASEVVVNVVDKKPWPDAKSDTVKAGYNDVISVPVLANDVGVELKVVSVNEGSLNQGKVYIDEKGVVKYQQLGEPRGNQTDSFWYVFEDKWGRKNAAKVTVYLSEAGSEAWPTATPDQAISENGLRVFIPVLANDTGDELTLKSTNDWTQNGGRTVIINDQIRYSPPKDFEGTDAFWYVFEDAQGRANSAKVEVEVTKNTRLSVVGYCGKTYETDGSPENTAVTELSALPAGPNYLSLKFSYLFPPVLTVDGRSYSKGLSQSLTMEVKGVKTTIATAGFAEFLRPVGAYNKHFYYTKNSRLFAHDGGITVKLTKFIEDKARLSEEEAEYNTVAEAYGNVLYLKTTANTFPYGKETYWRVSDGLDLKPVFLGFRSFRYDRPNRIWRAVIDKAYFNGLDYTANKVTAGQGTPPPTQSFEIIQQDGNKRLITIAGSFQRFFEHNDRFFVMTKAYDDRVNGQSTRKDGKLYVIDSDDSFVELAACTSGVD
ncbi:MAG: Ig-like domain-containing protein [Leucothrix sp.]